MPSTELTAYALWQTKADLKVPPTWAEYCSCNYTVHCDAPMESKTCNVCLKRPILSDHCKSLGDMLKEMLKCWWL